MRPIGPLALLPTLLMLVVACRAGGPQPSTAQPESASPSTATPPAAPGELRVTVIARGLEHPWGVAPLPDGRFLVTERPGRLRIVTADGAVSAPLTGVPEVFAEGQGGLLDVLPAPDFPTSRRIYLSYAEPGEGGTAGTAVGVGTLGEAGLTDFRRIYQQLPKVRGGMHFGSRLAFDRSGRLFVAQGDRNERPYAQRLDVLQGKLVRLDADGAAPPDNPFVNRAGARPEIYSYGHRNIQSLAVDPRTGTLWSAEHGPRGGDEINLPVSGRNYGWPVVTHGINYSGLKIPEATGKEAPGMEAPYHVWEKSPALSGMAFYTARPGSAWGDSLLLGALAGRSLIRLSLDGDRITGEERLLEDRGQRIRDVRVAADGAVYVLTDESDGALLRLDPPTRP